MKSVSRNKFLLCCRPIVLDMDPGKRPVGRAITYIAGGKKLPAGKPDDGLSAGLQEPVLPSPPKRTLSRVIRAVLFEVILSKSVRDKKGLRSSKRRNSLSREGSSASSSDASDENKTEDVEDQAIKSSSVVAELSCSITESRNRSSSRKSSMNMKQKQNAAAKQCHNSGMFLFLISLTITVLWGKLWAILFTSLWSYFLPLPGVVAANRRPETVAARFRKGSYYNKNVIEC